VREGAHPLIGVSACKVQLCEPFLLDLTNSAFRYTLIQCSGSFLSKTRATSEQLVVRRCWNEHLEFEPPRNMEEPSSTDLRQLPMTHARLGGCTKHRGSIPAARTRTSLGPSGTGLLWTSCVTACWRHSSCRRLNMFAGLQSIIAYLAFTSSFKTIDISFSITLAFS